MGNEVIKGENFFTGMGEMLKNQGKQGRQDKGDTAVAREFEKVNKKLDVMEIKVRVGEIVAKVTGRNAINQKPTFSKGKSQRVKGAEIRKRTVLGADNHEEQTIDEVEK